jgi:hypothetical protein
MLNPSYFPSERNELRLDDGVAVAVLGVVDPLDDEQLAVRRRLRALRNDEREVILNPARLRGRGRADDDAGVRALRRKVDLVGDRKWTVCG